MMELVCVRHGRTAWNATGRFQGQSDVPLDGEGRVQAQAVAGYLHGVAFDYAVSSDLVRARETAEVILAGRLVHLERDPDWREMAFGAWEGLTWEEITIRFPDLDRSAATRPQFYTPEGGESFDAVCARVASAMKKVTSAVPPGGRALVVTHAGALHALLRVLEAATERESLDVRFAPASVTRFLLIDAHWRLEVLNHTVPPAEV